MKLISWNINSVRLRLPSLLRLLDTLQPDLIGLQEIKCLPEQFPTDALAEAGYIHQHIVGQKAYHGVAMLARHSFSTLSSQFLCGKADARHAAVALDNGLSCHNFYVPAGGDIPDPALNDKFAHKLQFLDEMASPLFPQTPKSIWMGDLNVAPLPDDVWSHKQMLDVVSHTPVEVAKIEHLMQHAGWVDALRVRQPAPEKLYSWWSYRAEDWKKSNRGRRLDHIWLSPDLAGSLTDAGVYEDARGWTQPSDHAPIWVDLAL